MGTSDSSSNMNEVLYSLFLFFVKLRAIKIYWNKAVDHFWLILSFFKKQKKVWNILDHIYRTFNEGNNTIFLGTLESDFKGALSGLI